jgi:hypothetical protein
MLVQETEETDRQWGDFEMEETQIKLDISDMIMTEMIRETAEMMTKMQDRQLIE